MPAGGSLQDGDGGGLGVGDPRPPVPPSIIRPVRGVKTGPPLACRPRGRDFFILGFAAGRLRPCAPAKALGGTSDGHADALVATRSANGAAPAASRWRPTWGSGSIGCLARWAQGPGQKSRDEAGQDDDLVGGGPTVNPGEKPAHQVHALLPSRRSELGTGERACRDRQSTDRGAGAVSLYGSLC